MFESRAFAAAHTSAYLLMLNELGCSPATVTQLAERQSSHAKFQFFTHFCTRALARASSRLRSLAAGECAGDDFWYSIRNLRIPLQLSERSTQKQDSKEFTFHKTSTT
jgi:hypothetical protein